jgi:Ni,Fe-hydrogenase III large subunit
VAAGPQLNLSQLIVIIDPLAAAITADTHLLMNTPSFLDRLRGTGVLPAKTVSDFGALGPVARGSGFNEDVRWSRPYGAYAQLTPPTLDVRIDGDALARQRVRIREIEGSFELIRECGRRLEQFGQSPDVRWALPITPRDGLAVGWAEAPQGEVLSLVEVRDGALVRVKHRSASFHNLALFATAFPNDILTDFAFIEASFGLSIAGVAS